MAKRESSKEEQKSLGGALSEDQVSSASEPSDGAYKTLVFLRHGESVYNAHIAATGEDPMIRDAPVNDKGQMQATSAKSVLEEILKDLPIPRVVASPLRRALETALLAMPWASGRIEVWPEIRECISGCDDIGTPASELRACELAIQACGPGAKCLAELEEIWWTVPQELAGSLSAGEEMFKAYSENEELFEEADEQALPERLEAIVHRLAAVEEEVVVIVAHCDLIRELTEHLGLRQGSRPGWSLRNAEARVARKVRLPLDPLSKRAKV